MEQVIFILLLFLFTLYCMLILYYRRGWKGIPDFKPQTPGLKPATRISVIIPARNEEKHIQHCLDSIINQSYPKQLFEVWVVDDHSTDKTAEIINQYKSSNIKLVSLKDIINGEKLNAYKKKAIETAISQSTGELIVTTDADCIVPPDWLLTIAAFYEKEKVQFIAAPVSIDCNNRFIEVFQALDFMTLQGITGASVYRNIHSMCNGANLAYTKKAFEEVGGFTGIDHIASGDDMLLMHKIYKRYPTKVKFLKATEAIVQTSPVKTIREFFYQRIRWASKATSYDDKRIFRVLLIVYLFNLALFILPVVALFKNVSLGIAVYPVNIHVTVIELWLIMLIVKTAIELRFLYTIASFFRKRSLLWVFPLLQPFHVLYTIVAGGFGAFGSYTWKERRVK
jgi:cellulose synthase/poly-beta-1,6-N-acetylglucosamine synthase-like glycosyltransferase